MLLRQSRARRKKYEGRGKNWCGGRERMKRGSWRVVYYIAIHPRAEGSVIGFIKSVGLFFKSVNSLFFFQGRL